MWFDVNDLLFFEISELLVSEDLVKKTDVMHKTTSRPAFFSLTTVLRT